MNQQHVCHISGFLENIFRGDKTKLIEEDQGGCWGKGGTEFYFRGTQAFSGGTICLLHL